MWDAFHRRVRPGSLDENISGQELNDFSMLRTLAPKLRLICFNGKKAAHADTCLRQLGYDTATLPSSSGANGKSQDDRLRSWKTLLAAQNARQPCSPRAARHYIVTAARTHSSESLAGF